MATGKKSVIREFKLSSWAVDNRITIFVMTFIIIVLGMVSYTTMPKENFPEIVIPTIFIGTPYPGNSPVDIENLVTRPIEKELNTLSGVKKITSSSLQDYSSIVVEFNPDVEVAKALQDVRDAVAKAKSDLPSDLDNDPNVTELNFSDMPIMNVNLWGDFSPDELKNFAEYLKDEIEALPEISKVDIKGAQDREVEINIDLPRMTALEISFNDIENAIRAENITISGGDILVDDFRRTVRIAGEFENVDEIGNIIIKHGQGNIVFLKDIASVNFDFEERKSYARSDGLPVVSLDVKKRSGENLINAADKIKRIIEDAKKHRFPEDLEVTIINDQSKMTRDQLDNLENSIISGVILVVLVLLFFLGLRNALFVGVAIPLSMLTGFMLLGFSGVTMNLMILFSLILALGMLVDNGIVVVENIYRLMQEGYSPIRAAKEGVGEVAWPIITSTATTLAAFAPLLFWDDIMGKFMKYLPITLIIVLSSSLFVALVINPVLTSLWMKVQDSRRRYKPRRVIISVSFFLLVALIAHLLGGLIIRNLSIFIALLILLNIYVLIPVSLWFQNHVLVKLENGYDRLIRFALKKWNPYFFLGGVILLLILSVIVLNFFGPKQSLLPVNEPQYVNVFIELPVGTDIEYTNKVTKRIESIIEKTIEPYRDIVEAVLVNVGQGTSDPMENPAAGGSNSVTPNKARISIFFVEYQFRHGISTSDIMEKIRENLQGIPGVNIKVGKNRVGPPTGKPISIEISGEDMKTLINLTENIKEYIEDHHIPGIELLSYDIETGKPELLVHVDREAARRYGVSTSQIATAIRTALFGKEVSKFKIGEDDYPIVIRLNEDYRYDIDDLLNQHITFKDQTDGKVVHMPISAVASIEYSSTYDAIQRKNLDRVITLSSNVKEGFNATEIVNTLKQLLANYELPSGYEIKFTGEQEEQQRTFDFLFRALLIAVFLIFLIIVAQFNSLLTPFIIMASVLFSTIGVFLWLVAFQMDFIILMTGIGIISLAGVVVNNAIVLIDYTNLLRNRRLAALNIESHKLPAHEVRRCIIEAGKKRLRPVLLTAITTVLGLVPLAIGLNIDFFSLARNLDPNIYVGGDNVIFWGPMAWTVIFGLTFATFLTLVIVPVMYWLAYRLGERFTKEIEAF